MFGSASSKWLGRLAWHVRVIKPICNVAMAAFLPSSPQFLLCLWAGRLCHQLLRWNAVSHGFTIFHLSASCQLFWQRGLQAWHGLWPWVQFLVVPCCSNLMRLNHTTISANSAHFFFLFLRWPRMALEGLGSDLVLPCQGQGVWQGDPQKKTKNSEHCYCMLLWSNMIYILVAYRIFLCSAENSIEHQRFQELAATWATNVAGSSYRELHLTAKGDCRHEGLQPCTYTTWISMCRFCPVLTLQHFIEHNSKIFKVGQPFARLSRLKSVSFWWDLCANCTSGCIWIHIMEYLCAGLKIGGLTWEHLVWKPGTAYQSGEMQHAAPRLEQYVPPSCTWP